MFIYNERERDWTENGRDTISLNSLEGLIWSATLDIANCNNAIEVYCNTYAIKSDGMLCGSHNPRSPFYMLLSEFANISFKLVSLNLWEKYSDLWYTALSCAFDSLTADIQPCKDQNDLNKKVDLWLYLANGNYDKFNRMAQDYLINNKETIEKE